MSSPKKRGEGTSCHHCKKRIRPNEMLKCTRGEIVPTNSRKRKRPCVKKYCLHCIKTFYSNQYLDDNSSGSFICPACRDECRCAACRRRVMKARLKNDGSALENEADGEANSILESQTPDATNIEEGQVNGLLEILDSRPDVQDIIRRGMAMDFADDNAKILYVGHLIDQALTRPDVLALYYASSHGRANNCRIKTEVNDNDNKTITVNQQQQSINNNNNTFITNSPSNTTPNSHHKKHRKRRNHNNNNYISNGHSHSNSNSVSPHRNGRKNKHRKNNNNNNDNNNLPPQIPPNAITIKQEPHSLLNGISVPQPVTMSLSGGNPMSLIHSSTAATATFPPSTTTSNNNSNNNTAHAPHLSGSSNTNNIRNGLNIPANIPFPMTDQHQLNNNKNSNSNNNKNKSLNNGNNENNDITPPDQQSNVNQNNNNNMFNMNVTPSPMMGGPTLSAMSLSNM